MKTPYEELLSDDVAHEAVRTLAQIMIARSYNENPPHGVKASPASEMDAGDVVEALARFVYGLKLSVEWNEPYGVCGYKLVGKVKRDVPTAAS